MEICGLSRKVMPGRIRKNRTRVVETCRVARESLTYALNALLRYVKIPPPKRCRAQIEEKRQ